MLGQTTSMQTPAARRPATQQDVLDGPAQTVAKLLGGEVHPHPRPAARHALAASRPGVRLGGFGNDDGADGWWVLDEPDVHPGSAVIVPDLAGWPREHMPVFPDTACFDVVPDWIYAVLYPSTRRLDWGAKRDLYGERGVRHRWLVDPGARTLEAFERCNGAWVLLATLTDPADVRLAPIDAVAFSLGTLWPPSEAGDP